jgi:hypothetical protein
MNTQTIKNKINIFDLFTLASDATLPIEWEVVQSPDSNFYEDEDELAQELAAPAPAGVIIEWPAEIDPDEFDTSYQWFVA